MLKKTVTLPTTPTDYPDNTFIQTEKGYFYIVNSTKRLRFISERGLKSWSPHRVVRTTEAAVKKYRVTAKMKFRNGSLIWNIADGKVYLIENSLRRWVTSPDVYDRLGIKHSEVVCVSQEEIEIHQQGENLT